MKYQVVSKEWDAHTEPHMQTISLREVIQDSDHVEYGAVFTIVVADAVWQSITPSKTYSFGQFVDVTEVTQ